MLQLQCYLPALCTHIVILAYCPYYTATPLTETARHRRRTRLRKQLAQKSESETLRPQSAGPRPLPELEDSAARVASLLQEKLQSEDRDAFRPVRSQERVEVPQASVTIEDREHSAVTGDQSERPLPGEFIIIDI